METLAGIFVGVVMFVNSVVPQANLPQVLGIEEEGDEVETSVQVTATSSPKPFGSRTNSESIREKAQKLKDDLKAKIETKRGGIKLRAGEGKENENEDGQDREADAEEREAKREELRLEFKKKIAEIRDENKKKVLEKLDQNFDNINTKRTEQMTKFLDRLEEILNKIKSENPDDPRIAGVEEKLAIARTAVSDQAAKNYDVTITEEGKLGAAAKTTIQQMKSDLKSVEEKVKAVKDALKKQNNEQE